MASIKKILPMETNLELKNITEYLKPANIDIPQPTSKPRAFLLDAASYNNLGDQAITYAISVFLGDLFGEDCYFEVSERDLLRNLKYLKSAIRIEDVICLNGGGNMGNLYPRYEALRRKAIKAFPDNRIIVFPQTIDYEIDLYGKRELERSRKVYNSHKHLVVCAREKKSFDLMKKLYRNVILEPDIVLYLKGRITWDKSEKKDCVGVCLRDDRESVISAEQKNIIYSSIKEAGFKAERLTTMSDSCQVFMSSDDRFKVLQSKLQEFSGYRCIITDRLHGMIFSVLADVPCIAIDNSNKKVSGVFETVRESGYAVEILNNCKTIDSTLKELLSNQTSSEKTAPSYEEIKQLIRKDF